MVSFNEVERQAKYLAEENRKADPEITKVYWFPDENQVRLVELHKSVPAPEDEKDVHPFFFRASPDDGLPAPSGIALIRPDQFRKLNLPSGWGTWDDAVELGEENDLA